MALLIDGYNLLHVTGVTGSRGGLQGSREALLRLLTASIDAAERPRTTIVFDAAEAPPGLPRVVMVEEMTVRYATDYEDADELIEELIAADHVPRSLLVVSSDHRIQRAARRRRAAFVDSDVWLADVLRRRNRNRRAVPRAAKPTGGLTPDEIAYWMAEFGDLPEIETPPATRPPSRQDGKNRPKKTDPPGDLSNPFPPGYGEDLLDEG